MAGAVCNHDQQIIIESLAYSPVQPFTGYYELSSTMDCPQGSYIPAILLFGRNFKGFYAYIIEQESKVKDYMY